MTESTSTSSKHRFAVLAEIGQVLADRERRPRFREDPVSTVQGFDTLPEDLQSAFRSMSDEELAAAGRLNDALIKSGFLVQNDGDSAGIF